WVDNLTAYGTPNYYVQKMFATNRGTHVLPILADEKPLTGQNDLYATAALDEASNEIILKIVNTSDKAQQKEIVVEGVKKVGSKGKMSVLKSNDLAALNSLENPKALSPVDEEIKAKGNKLDLTFAPYSVNVIRVKK